MAMRSLFAHVLTSAYYHMCLMLRRFGEWQTVQHDKRWSPLRTRKTRRRIEASRRYGMTGKGGHGDARSEAFRNVIVAPVEAVNVVGKA